MLHDVNLLDRLAAYEPIRFDGDLFRATRRGLDPLVASVSGGRWMVPGEAPALYTSCEHDGAIAEIVHHWNQLTPRPTKPICVHTIEVRINKTLRLGRAELGNLGVDWPSYAAVASGRTQAIGAAVAHLEFHGLIAPSARWSCDNVILFPTNHDAQDTLYVSHTVEVDWQDWIKTHDGTAR